MRLSMGRMLGSDLVSRALGILALAGSAAGALGGGEVVGWGGNPMGQINPCAQDVVVIAAGFDQSLFLTGGGEVAVCGGYRNPSAFCPCGDLPVTPAPALEHVVALAGGDSHSLALMADGTVAAWGQNTNGQLAVPADATGVVAIAACGDQSLALRADGRVVAWGAPSAVPPDLSNVVAVAAGVNAHALSNPPGAFDLALKADGTVVGWDSTGAMTPPPPAWTNVVAISAGWNEWLGLRADGSVVGWGWINAPTDLTNAVALAASPGSDYHISVVLRKDGTAVGGGFNFYGGPLVPPGLTNLVAIAAGSGHNLALVGGGPPFVGTPLADRTAVANGTAVFYAQATGAWPLSFQWQINGADLPGATNVSLCLTNVQPAQAGAYSVAVSNAFGVASSQSASLAVVPVLIEASPHDQVCWEGGAPSFAVVAQGSPPLAYHWMLNGADLPGATNDTLTLTNAQTGQAGAYSVSVSNALGGALSAEAHLTIVPLLITTQPQDQVAFIGGPATFSVAAQASVPSTYQWEFNGAALPGGTNATLDLPDAQPADAGQYSVALSNPFGTVTSLAARLSVVPVAAWGYPGQSDVPPDLTNVLAIAGGYEDSLVLTTDHTVVGWGELAVAPPPGLTNVVGIAAGIYFNLALRADGTVAAWGQTDSGYGLTNVPPGLTNAVAIAARDLHAVALSADGRVTAWGQNFLRAPAVPAGLSNVVAVAAGSSHILALKDDGTVVAWGDDDFGENDLPADLSNVVAIAAGAWHNLALKANGTVVGFGYDGDGSATVPDGLTNVVAIACGDYHSLVLQADGQVTAWGRNDDGAATVPPQLKCAAAIAAGAVSSLALVPERPPPLAAPSASPVWRSDRFSLSVPTEIGHVYRLEYKDLLTDGQWHPLPLTAGNGALRALTDPSPTATQRFYRVRRW